MSEIKTEEAPVEETIEIIEEAPVVEEAVDISELPAVEQKMAKDLGIAPKEEVKKEEPKVEKKLPTLEEVEANEKDLLGKLSKPDQGIYFQYKAEKKKRQDAQAERDLVAFKEKTLRDEVAKAQEEGSLTRNKLDKINKLLSGSPEEITIEAIQEILSTDVKKPVDNKDKPLTKADLEQMQKEADAKAKAEKEANEQFVTRINSLEEFGKTKFENYDEIIAQAKEVLDGKVELPEVIDNKDISRRLVEKVNDPKNDAEDIAEFVLGIAKLNPNYGKAKESGKPEGTKKSSEDIDKIIKNAAKGQSSASVPSGTSRRISVNDITIEEAAKLSPEAYKKLPVEVRERLRKEAM